MDVIFTKNVPGSGKIDEVKEVSDGYAINYLFTHGFAIRATPEAVAAAEKRRQARAQQSEKQTEQLRSFVGQLQGKLIVIRGSVSSGGTFYAGVTPEQVAVAIQREHGVPVLPEQVELKEHLKKLGNHPVTVNLGGNEKVQITVRLEAM